MIPASISADASADESADKFLERWNNTGLWSLITTMSLQSKYFECDLKIIRLVFFTLGY